MTERHQPRQHGFGTAIPRWSSLLAGAMLVVMLAAACGRGGDTPSKPALGLLSTSDVGANWTLRPPDNFPESGLCGAQQAAAFKSASADAVIIMEGPLRTTPVVDRPTVVELLFRRDSAGVHDLLEEVRRQFQSCNEFTSTNGRNETMTKLSSLDAPMLGDDAIAYRESITGVPLFGPLTRDTVLIRKGDLLVVFSLTSHDSDTGLFQMLAQKAVAKATST